MHSNLARITIGPQRLFRFAQPRYTSFNYKILICELATRLDEHEPNGKYRSTNEERRIGKSQILKQYSSFQ